MRLSFLIAFALLVATPVALADGPIVWHEVCPKQLLCQEVPGYNPPDQYTQVCPKQLLCVNVPGWDSYP